jgi:ribokinase
MEGEEVLKELQTEGVDTQFCRQDSDDHTAYSTILVYPDGERTILSYKGEGHHFDVAKMPIDSFEAKWLYLDSLGGHYDLFEALVNHGVKNNIKIASNPGGKELDHGLEKLKPLLKHIDIFGVNAEEGAGLVGTKPEEQHETLKRLSEVCGGIIILTDGHNGAKVLANGVLYTAGVPDSPVVERTGAGDAFNSGFVSEYTRSGDIKKAIQFATANSSSVVTKDGSKAGILKEGDWGPWPLVEVTEQNF